MSVITLSQFTTDLTNACNGIFAKFMFGYLGEINGLRGSNAYPVMLLLPPESTTNDIYKGDAVFNCVFHCYIYNAEALDNSQNGLQSSYDVLQDLFDSAIQELVKNNESKYILGGTLNVERVSREFNDNLVGIVCTMPIRMFTSCYNYN